MASNNLFEDEQDDMENLNFHQASSSSRFDEYMSAGFFSSSDPLSSPSPRGPEEDEETIKLPSYEDVVRDMEPYVDNRVFFMRISVTDPQKVTESANFPGTGTYVTYLVTTETNFPEYSNTRVVVRRRFRDFVTLSDRLSEKYRGYFIPPRPDKSVVESQVMFSRDFVENRRISLQKYLQRLSVHPEIRRSDELRIFLESEGKLPLPNTIDAASRILEGAVQLPGQLFGSESTGAVPTIEEASQPAKGGKDLLRMFKELRQSVSNEWIGSSRGVGGEEDKVFLEKKEKVFELERLLVEGSSKAEQLIRTQQDLSSTLGELGLSFMKLSKYEESHSGQSQAQKAHASDAKKFGSAAVMSSRMWKESTGQGVQHLSQLHEYLGSISAIHVAIADRSQAQITAQTLTLDLESKKEKLIKLQEASKKVLGGDQARTRKIGDLQKEIIGLEAAEEAAIVLFEKIKARNLEEFGRFENEKNRDFYGMVEGFVRTQVRLAEGNHRIWANMAEEWRNSNRGRSIAPIH